MYSTLIVGRMQPQWSTEVAELFGAFDDTEMPHRMGTRRRELFHYQGLYFHLQDFDGEYGGDRIAQARTDPRFIRISADLKPFIRPYDPATWRSPTDALATRFYHWADRS
ncbi:TcmI family type II polyketide cyclase [Salinispora tropica]|uniref:Polyketide synthesis cyclase n=1 Tax=Salinispora tropica (strain ATCC BAA-916 / DSM 44818 / JCM 13857 / NBRC 105044 / CNB-440) TaxID=369723 RepID=A4X6Z4_SALTO|nr:TcmI family type II polyketide cyclase [Salinispora tropica]ABP54644.1 Polyketide synthesis cyclase [Salinispora tropica CNB-440]